VDNFVAEGCSDELIYRLHWVEVTEDTRSWIAKKLKRSYISSKQRYKDVTEREFIEVCSLVDGDIQPREEGYRGLKPASLGKYRAIYYEELVHLDNEKELDSILG